ncbi:MAG: Proline iminopeptidase [Candidatus Heimdallarchaeota archaeon LC_2]|nr:MAG: Proline iminopeptidase [Candidatus Heimdallarchaeota archaeon LC_2]
MKIKQQDFHSVELSKFMPFCNSNGINLYYEVKGKGEPLVLIAGITADITIWPPNFLDVLTEKYQVIIFDNRGVGKTDVPKELYSMDQFVEDTMGLINHLNLTNIHLYGESMGGMIALNFVLKYPQVVKSLLLPVTTVGRGGHRLSEDSMELLANHRKGDYKTDQWKFFEAVYTSEFFDKHYNEIKNYIDNPPDYPIQKPHGYRNQLLAIYNHATKEKLNEIKMPTLVLVGLKDKLISPENSLLIHKLIPHSKLIEYPNAAHMFRFEEPKAVYDMIEFLENVV